jgi:hypothetical protein
VTISPAARRVLALEQLLPLAPRPKSPAMLELKSLLAFVTDAELDQLERIYDTAAVLNLAEPLAADRPRVVEIMQAAHDRRRQAGEPPA